MIIYTGTSWNKDQQIKCADMGIGMMSSPVDIVHPDSIIKEVSVSCDNGAFRNYRDKTVFDEKKFYSWLNSIERKIDFVAIPDKVCEKDSYEFSKKHYKNISHTKYFVAQDGMTFDAVFPVLSECDGCFIGGSTVIGKCKGWKWTIAPHFVENCHEIGLPVHMGRCPGNVKGLFAATSIGIDSIDSSTLIRNQRLWRIPKLNRLVSEQQNFGGLN
jgi:hypothetical protein